jgi:enoyl-CoA hydratase
MEHVRVEHSDGVAVVTLDRPPVNALAQQTFEELARTFEGLSEQRAAGAAVLRATGDKAFCAGVDLEDSPLRFRPDGRREDGGPKGNPRYQVDPGLVVRDCFWGIYDCAIPVVAAVDHAAIGAGVALAASCDLIVASSRARFALTEINVGVLGGVRHAQRLVGPYLAKRMFLTGEFVEAEEVYRRSGGIDRIVPPDQLLDRAMDLARTIASKSPLAVRLAKESANRVEQLSLKDGYRTEQDYTLRVRRHSDSDEARKAFLEHRPPNFDWE